MRNVFLKSIGLCAAVAFSATAANAETASSGSCAQAQHKISQALAGDSGSASHEQAVKESHYGRDFCNSGLYKQGMVHYVEAMKLLGIS